MNKCCKINPTLYKDIHSHEYGYRCFRCGKKTKFYETIELATHEWDAEKVCYNMKAAAHKQDFCF